MKVLISGASGSFGTALSKELREAGHEITALSRSKPSSGDTVRWDPSRGSVDASRLEGYDAVVHLAGESLNEVPWTPQKKARIKGSRVEGTRVLSEAIAKLSDPPKVMVSVSGINYYGSRGNELLTEDSGLGSGFLAEVCREWEAAADPAREAGVRVVHPRFGIVFPQGFALNLMGLEVGVRHPKFEVSLGAGGSTLARLPFFKLTGGGWFGDGNQYWSWSTIDETAGVILHSIATESLHGPVNAVPNPVTAREYTKTLNRILNRPTVFPLPAPVARMALGDFADEMLLSSIRVDSTKLRESGYEFRHPDLETALRHLLGQ